MQLKKHHFGDQFLWGIATAAQQNEGAYMTDGRGLSIWDTFAKRSGKIEDGSKPSFATDFYHRYKDDLMLAKALGFTVFRFSFAWSRILPEGTGKINKEGVAFYHKLVDAILQLDMVPMATIYHWDLPQALEAEGGWTSHRMTRWFNRYAAFLAEEYGDSIKHWLVLNEPMGFTSLGYMLGKHAPGKMGISNFFPAVHNALLCQADGGNMLKATIKNGLIGTTFSMSEVMPNTDSNLDVDAAKRLDALLNRLFLEPSLGRGYPQENGSFFEKMELHNKGWKYIDRMKCNFDFIGIQNYFAVTAKHNPLVPYIQLAEVTAKARKVPHTQIGWEINADSMYRIIKRVWHYGSVKSIMITENGACFKDKLINGEVNDAERIQYFSDYLQALYKAKQEGVNLKGYLAWTLTDNFEWNMGYEARFGLVHVDFKSQLRTIKNSGYWWRNFLK